MKIPELLAPAGNLEKLEIAIHYGADAVYLAGKNYGLRAGAGNFTAGELARGVELAHRQGVRVYVTVNIFPHNRDLDGLPEYLHNLQAVGVDGLIVADPGIIDLAREVTPQLPLHLSTQANNVNWAAIRFWERQGIKRVVLARELSLVEIQEIRLRTGVELEIFIHGAMCISYSGRCLISSYLTGRDANQGDCAQPCRWSYALVEEKRPGEFFPVEEDPRGSYIFNSRDLCLLEYLPRLIVAGLSSLKIEGRMKSIHYVATVVNVYRRALDRLAADPANWRVEPEWLEELDKVSHRPYTTGFINGGQATQEALTVGYIRECDFVGIVKHYDQATGIALIEQRNRFAVGDNLEYFGPETLPFSATVAEIRDENGESLPAAPHPRMLVQIPVSQPVRKMDLVRRPKAD